MDLDLTSDQELLRETTAKFIAAMCPLTTVRAWAGSERGYEPSYLTGGAELGWFAFLVPEEHGGGSISGDGLLDAVVVAEERGRFVQPGPFLPTNVVAAALVAAGTATQQAEVLPALAAGEEVATWALADPAGSWAGPDGVTATATGPGFVLSGTKSLVQDAHVADWLLVTAALEGRPVQFLVRTDAPGVEVRPKECLDLARRLADVTFRDAAVEEAAVVGATDGSAVADVARQLDVALVLNVAETVGATGELLGLSVQYAKDRVAFGRPIGSFQGLKHQLADASLLQEMCLAGATAAARAVQAGAEGASALVATVASFVDESAHSIGQTCFQVHGGIGYTWEHDLHLYLRRAAVNGALYGSPDWHRERLCSLSGI